MRSFFSNLVASPRFSFYVTGLLFIILFGIGSISFEGFFSPQVFLNLFIDNAPLIIRDCRRYLHDFVRRRYRFVRRSSSFFVLHDFSLSHA